MGNIPMLLLARCFPAACEDLVHREHFSFHDRRTFNVSAFEVDASYDIASLFFVLLRVAQDRTGVEASCREIIWSGGVDGRGRRGCLFHKSDTK